MIEIYERKYKLLFYQKSCWGNELKLKKILLIGQISKLKINTCSIDLTNAQYKKVTNIALKAHKLLMCGGVSRSDFRFYNNKFYLLETNTQPGMTSLSLVPEIAKFNNISFKNLIEKILIDASINK